MECSAALWTQMRFYNAYTEEDRIWAGSYILIGGNIRNSVHAINCKAHLHSNAYNCILLQQLMQIGMFPQHRKRK